VNLYERMQRARSERMARSVVEAGCRQAERHESWFPTGSAFSSLEALATALQPPLGGGDPGLASAQEGG